MQCKPITSRCNAYKLNAVLFAFAFLAWVMSLRHVLSENRLNHNRAESVIKSGKRWDFAVKPGLNGKNGLQGPS